MNKSSFRISHISDIHWRGIARHDEYTTAFERLFEKLKALKPDIIVNTGDTFHTKTQGITPEIIDRLSWMFRGLADIAPTYTLLGNHDCVLTNLNRLDIITPIHKSINHPNAHLLSESKSYKIEHNKKQDIYLSAFSLTDRKNWPNVKPVNQEAINIALFHGSISGSEMDNEWKLHEGEEEIAKFKEFDFVLLGDIHKQQWISKRIDKHGNTKPWMAYPGSLIQQNFGETETKGFLVWDIESKNEWEVKFHELENNAPFVSVSWEGSVQKTVDKISTERGDRAFLPGTRYRIISSQSIPSIETRKLVHELKEAKGATEVAFKYDLISKMDHIDANNMKISKKGLRQDPDAVSSLYRDYISAHAENYNFTLEQIAEAEELIKLYMQKLTLKEADLLTSDSNWSIKSFEFDNLYRYGENNVINFTNLDGIVGIFAPNKTGKSSIIGALMFTLYNTSDRGSLKNAFIINQRKKYAKGSIRITVGTDEYVIERQTSRVLSKKNLNKDLDKSTTTVNLYKIEYDEETGEERKVSKNSISRDETDKLIRKLIGTSNDFLLTALASQGQVDSFIKEGPTERKNILSRFLELDIFKNLEELVKKDFNAMNARSNLLSAESLAAQIKKTRKEIQYTEDAIADIDGKLSKLNQQKDEVKLWLMHHEKTAAEIDMAQMAKMEKNILDLEKSILEKQEEMETLVNKIEIDKQKLLDIKSKKKLIDVLELKRQVEDLEDVKLTLNELKHELATQEGKLSSQKKNVRKLDLVPCGDEYPQCYYIKDAHFDKKNLEKQETMVDSLTNQVNAHQTKLNEYVQKKIKENIVLWQKLDREEFTLNAEVSGAKKQKAFLKTEISTFKINLKKYKSDFSSLQKKVNVLEGKEFEAKKLNLDKLLAKIKDLDTEKHNMLVSLGGKKERMASLILEQEETKNLIDRLKLCDSIQAAFSKTGIPAMVLKSQLPAINTELSKILSGVADFKITLETDVNSNVMDVFIEDAHSKRIIELASGMEKTIASLALRVSLINLSSLPKPDIFIIDEGFSALDEENVQNCMEMLTFLRNYFKTILIISHVPQIKEVADTIIEIKNDGLDSQVNV